MTEKDLLKLKDQIAEAKQEKSRLEGRQEALLEELLEKWNCANISDAEALLTELEKEEKDLQQKINKGLAELEANYDIN